MDLTYLETISGGDKDFIKEMLTMFLTSTFPELKNIKQHAHAGLWEQMSSTAHKIKAPIQMLGVPEVSELAFALEQLGKTTTTISEVESKIVQLESFMVELETEIKIYLES